MLARFCVLKMSKNLVVALWAASHVNIDPSTHFRQPHTTSCQIRVAAETQLEAINANNTLLIKVIN